MIVDAIFGLFQNVMIWLVSFFPETSIDFGTTGLGSYLQSANQFINMPLLISFVSVFIVYEGNRFNSKVDYMGMEHIKTLRVI